MRLLAVPLLVDCSSPRCPRCSSSRGSSALSTVCAGKLLMLAVSGRKVVRRRTGMAKPMQSQTESNPLPHETPQLSVVGAPRRSNRGWLIAGAVLLIFAGIVVFGILARLRKGATARAETAQMAV